MASEDEVILLCETGDCESGEACAGDRTTSYAAYRYCPACSERDHICESCSACLPPITAAASALHTWRSETHGWTVTLVAEDDEYDFALGVKYSADFIAQLTIRRHRALRLLLPPTVQPVLSTPARGVIVGPERDCLALIPFFEARGWLMSRNIGACRTVVQSA